MNSKEHPGSPESPKICQERTGSFKVGGQKHFFLETNSAYATPGEDGKVEVFSSNQSLASTQSAVASALGVKEADVTLVCRRAALHRPRQPRRQRDRVCLPDGELALCPTSAGAASRRSARRS